MFYCKECAIKNNLIKGLTFSYGKCEVCKKQSNCYDVSSSALSPNKTPYMKQINAGSETKTYKPEYKKIIDVLKVGQTITLQKSIWRKGAWIKHGETTRIYESFKVSVILHTGLKYEINDHETYTRHMKRSETLELIIEFEI